MESNPKKYAQRVEAHAFESLGQGQNVYNRRSNTFFLKPAQYAGIGIPLALEVHMM